MKSSLLFYVVPVKHKVKISQNFVAFSEYMNFNCFQKQSPGNHEFDDTIDGFMPFLQNITFPIVCCNIEDQYGGEEQKLSNYIKKSIVVEVNDRKIGIVGYVTPETAVS